MSIPVAFHSDRFSIFRENHTGLLRKDSITQFQRDNVDKLVRQRMKECEDLFSLGWLTVLNPCLLFWETKIPSPRLSFTILWQPIGSDFPPEILRLSFISSSPPLCQSSFLQRFLKTGYKYSRRGWIKNSPWLNFSEICIYDSTAKRSIFKIHYPKVGWSRQKRHKKHKMNLKMSKMSRKWEENSFNFRKPSNFSRVIYETVSLLWLTFLIIGSDYSTVTDFARFLGWSISNPRKAAIW